jgi:tetratricopeptide (TPR) repeat protein
LRRFLVEGHPLRGHWVSLGAAWQELRSRRAYPPIVESLLGLRLEVDRLYVEPLIPAEWNGFVIHYRYHQTVYHLHVRKQAGSGKVPVARVCCDGREQPDKVVTLCNDGKEHAVEIIAAFFGNGVEMQLDQGKVSEAAATAARIGEISPWYAAFERVHLLYAQGEDSTLHALADSLVRKGEGIRHLFGMGIQRSLLLRDGRLAEQAQRRKEMTASRFGASLPDDSLYEMWLDVMARGPSAALDARLDSAIAAVPFHELPMVDRPYLFSSVVLARAGNATKARAMIARYRSEMTDTSIRRAQEAELHSALGEIALADRKPLDALVEFRRGDVGYDGLPASECAPCLPFNLARAFDAAGKTDSAAVMFERYLSTPYFSKTDAEMDPVRLPAVHERLGQLYESMGNTEKAIEHYRAFIDLWKKADPELQPRVADARKRLARLTPVEKPRT